MQRYAVFGAPIRHSLSPRIHRLFAAQRGHSIIYHAVLSSDDNFATALRLFFATGGKGANITAPFKKLAFHLADELTASAQDGAVNTLKLLPTGAILGDNTDGIGLVDDFERVGVTLEAQQILVVGAGGSARGIVPALLAAKPREVVISNRTCSSAVDLVGQFYSLGPIRTLPMGQLNTSSFDIIINTTPPRAEVISLFPPQQRLRQGCICYDLSYHPSMTQFLLWGREKQCRRLINGLGMLVSQAAYAFLLWHGVMPEVAPVLTALQQKQFPE